MEALGPDSDLPAPGNQFAQFAAGCFWGVELAFQRIHGVANTEVGYSQGTLHNPTYPDVCTGKTSHAEIVRVQYDPNQCAYETLLDLFWSRHDPTSLNRQVSRLISILSEIQKFPIHNAFIVLLATTTSSSEGSPSKDHIALDLSDECAFAVKWVVVNYLRLGDYVILLYNRQTNILYRADWDSIDLSTEENIDEESQQKLEDHFDTFTLTKASNLAQPLVDGHIPFKIHIVKDHNMKERLCLEVDRLGLRAVIIGSWGFGASKRTYKVLNIM